MAGYEKKRRDDSRGTTSTCLMLLNIDTCLYIHFGDGHGSARIGQCIDWSAWHGFGTDSYGFGMDWHLFGMNLA